MEGAVMFDNYEDIPVEMVRVGCSTPEERLEFERNKIAYGKERSELSAIANQRAKHATCIICNKPCSSFCNSHSTPSFAIKRIAVCGKIAVPLHGDILGLGTDFGVKKAGVFHLICNDCDSTVFRDYEEPAAYKEIPTNKMLAQIAVKNYLRMVWKREYEIEMWRLRGVRYPEQKPYSDMRIRIAQFDLQGYQSQLQCAIKALSDEGKQGYYLCYHRVLDYVVPYASQAAIAMLADFEDNVINNLLRMDCPGDIKDIHVAIFPLERTSIVLMFIENSEKRYRKFYRQLKKLSAEDQLAAINYIIFSYIEDVYMNPTIQQELKSHAKFVDVCRKTTDYIAAVSVSPEMRFRKTIQEFSLTKRSEIPNLLSQEYSLSQPIE